MTTDHVSAEQLSIAVLAEARKLYDRCIRGLTGRELESVADRLAQLASDLRQLGVQHFTEVSRLNKLLQEKRDSVNELEGKFDDLYSLCKRPVNSKATADRLREIRKVLDRE